MSVRLQKGQKVSLTKEMPGLTRVIAGLGWDEAVRPKGHGLFARKPKPVDCDAFAVLLQGGKLADYKDVVCFEHLVHASGAVRHMGDNLTGAGDGDDERIVIDLEKIPERYDRIVLGVNIYMAAARNQNFGMIQNAFIRLVDARTPMRCTSMT